MTEHRVEDKEQDYVYHQTPKAVIAWDVQHKVIQEHRHNTTDEANDERSTGNALPEQAKGDNRKDLDHTAGAFELK